MKSKQYFAKKKKKIFEVHIFFKNNNKKKSYGPSSDACSSNMVSSLTAAASVVLLISSATRASSFLNIKKKKNNLPIKNGLPTKCPPYSLLDSNRQQLESTKVIGSLLVIIHHRSLGHDPRQEPHPCNIHLSCSLRKLCHNNH